MSEDNNNISGSAVADSTGAIAATSGPNKKRKFLDPSSLDLSENVPPERFLRFHFETLQSLYEPDEIGASIWDSAKAFLEQRHQLLDSKKHVIHMKEIRNESALFTRATEETETHPPSTANNVMTMSMPSPGTPLNRTRTITKPSPVYSHNHVHYPAQLLSTAGIILSQQASFAGRGRGRAPPNDIDIAYGGSGSGSTFYVLTRLLDCRHDLVATEFAQLAAPYQPLLDATQAIVAALQHQLSSALHSQGGALQKTVQQKMSQDLLAATVHVYQRHPPSPDRIRKTIARPSSADVSMERSRLAKMECQMRLWSLLAQDLIEAITMSSELYNINNTA